MALSQLSTRTAEDWRARASALTYTANHFIDGEYRTSTSGARFEAVNPATGEMLTDVASGEAADVDAAVASAKASFERGTWSRADPDARAEVLQRFAGLIETEAETLALTEALNIGKPIRDVIGADLPNVIGPIRFAAEALTKMTSDVTTTRHDALHYTLNQPLGVVGAITPWNFPMPMAAWKFAPALAAGNSVVLKPAEQSPLTALTLGRLFVEAGGPAGVFNVVAGFGETAGKALALHRDVAKIAFTGSTEVGKLMHVYAGQSNLKRVALECGGKSPHIFFADLDDLGAAVDAALFGIYDNVGQVCNAGSRLLVERGIYDEFIALFTERAPQTYAPGDPLDPATTLGSLISRERQQAVLQCIEGGKAAGATLAFGGDMPAHLGKGAFLNPALFTGVTPDMAIAREEIFGPVAVVLPFDGEGEAVRLANDTGYGLAAGVWSSNAKRIHRVIRDLECGVVWANGFDTGDLTQPFGGWKLSGNSQDNGVDAIRNYTHLKSAWVELSQAGT